MTTNDCGHDVVHEDSVLRCAMCEAEERQRDADSVWNAAIEAAAKLVQSGCPDQTYDMCSCDEHGHASDIRALKREAK